MLYYSIIQFTTLYYNNISSNSTSCRKPSPGPSRPKARANMQIHSVYIHNNDDDNDTVIVNSNNDNNNDDKTC